jgi:hypothetical protein
MLEWKDNENVNEIGLGSEDWIQWFKTGKSRGLMWT